MNCNELRATRIDHLLAAEKLVKAAKASGKDLAGEELTQYEQHLAEMRNIDTLIAKSEAVKAHVGGSAARNPGDMFGGLSTPAQSDSWTDPRSGQHIQVLNRDQRMADLVAHDGEPLSLGKCLRGAITGKWDGAPREVQAMSEGSLGGGGYLLPAPLSAQIIDRVRNQAVVLQAGAKVVPMESSTLSIARVAASGGDVTPMWHTEAATINSSDMAFEKVTFTAQTLAALATMSVELYEDAAGLDVLLADSIAKVLAIELDRACLCGTGTAPQPKGIVNQTGVTIDSTTFTTNGSLISATAPVNAVAWDWLAKQVSALWSVNENPNAAIYSARTAGELDLLRASTGAVLPPPGSVAGLQLLRTNSIPNNLTQGSSNTCSQAIIGNFEQAMIGMRRELVLEISRTANAGSTSLFSTMQVGVRCYLRADFQLARPGAFRVVNGIL
jgi:HK97 family phage major capsid protein